MKANVANCSLLSQPMSIGVPLCEQRYSMSALPHYLELKVFCSGTVYSAMISLSAVYFFALGSSFDASQANKGLTSFLQVLVIEQRSKEYHAGCSNTSVIAARVSLKEMVEEREQ